MADEADCCRCSLVMDDVDVRITFEVDVREAALLLPSIGRNMRGTSEPGVRSFSLLSQMPYP